MAKKKAKSKGPKQAKAAFDRTKRVLKSRPLPPPKKARATSRKK